MTTALDHAPPGLVDTGPVRSALFAGMAWFYDITQPAEAVLQHHGVHLWHDPDANRQITAVPRGASGQPVLVVDLIHMATNDQFELTNPLGDHGLEFWTALVDQAAIGWGTWVAQLWNWTGASDQPLPTGSVALSREASPSLHAAVDRYHRGCPEHPYVPGVTNTEAGVFCRCGWFETGNELMVPPHWPTQLGAAHSSTI